MCDHTNAHVLVGDDLERNRPAMIAQLEQIFPNADVASLLRSPDYQHAYCPDCGEFMIKRIA